METFAKLFERFLVFVYHCFDRIVIQGYLPLLTRPEHIVHFFRDVHGQYPITPSPGQANSRIPGMGRRLRPKPQNPNPQSASAALIGNGVAFAIPGGERYEIDFITEGLIR